MEGDLTVGDLEAEATVLGERLDSKSMLRALKAIGEEETDSVWRRVGVNTEPGLCCTRAAEMAMIDA